MTGFGSNDDLTVNFLAKKGLKFVSVPFPKPGERYSAILGGHADVLYEQIGDVRNFVDNKQMKPVIMFAEKRDPNFPDVPTSVELGHKVTLPQFRAIVVKAGTDAKIVKKLADALAEAAKDPEYVAYLKEQYADPNSFVPAAKTKAYPRQRAQGHEAADRQLRRHQGDVGAGDDHEVAAHRPGFRRSRAMPSPARARARDRRRRFRWGRVMQASAKSAPFVILFCAALFLFSLTLQFEFPHAPGRLGPDVWPQAILVLADAYLRDRHGAQLPGARARRSRAAAAAWRCRATIARELEVPSRYMLVVLGFALFLIYPVALEYLGFLVGDVPADGALHVVGQWRSPLGVLATSAIGTLVLFYIVPRHRLRVAAARRRSVPGTGRSGSPSCSTCAEADLTHAGRPSPPRSTAS